jgi:hypothetical protein
MRIYARADGFIVKDSPLSLSPSPLPLKSHFLNLAFVLDLEVPVESRGPIWMLQMCPATSFQLPNSGALLYLGKVPFVGLGGQQRRLPIGAG